MKHGNSRLRRQKRARMQELFLIRCEQDGKRKKREEQARKRKEEQEQKAKREKLEKLLLERLEARRARV